MRDFRDSFETRKRSLVGAFSIYMTVPLRFQNKKNNAIQYYVHYVKMNFTD